ncbi:MAG: 3-hydroxyacyl-CoA dehydrogenase family protein [Thermomicrobiales bacterium]|nr:3-hydroxyacyl-CoA dehydrogenase family protein [Thermomicrobiales bacterium]
MSMTEPYAIAVVGGGLMGHGIALDFARHGLPVALHDRGSEQLARSEAMTRASLDVLVETGLVPAAEAGPTLARLRFEPNLPAAVADADLVVEAVFEDLALKQAVFAELSAHAPAHAVLASNTSSFMPSQLAEGTIRPERVVVTHYFHPPHLMPLVEIVPGPQTDPAVVETLRALYTRMGKQPVVVRKETPGFVGNRLQMALLREAAALVAAGVATPEEIDAIVQAGFGRRLAVSGLFEMRDLSGWTVSLAVADELFPDLATSSAIPDWLRTHTAALARNPPPRKAAQDRRERLARDLAALARLVDESGD